MAQHYTEIDDCFHSGTSFIANEVKSLHTAAEELARDKDGWIYYEGSEMAVIHAPKDKAFTMWAPITD